MNTQFRREIKLLLQAGLLIFSFTVVVGILNGLDAMDVARPRLMAHVHACTLGWISLGFVVGLMLQSAPIKQVFAPIMGASILIAIVTYLLRLRAAPETATAS